MGLKSFIGSLSVGATVIDDGEPEPPALAGIIVSFELSLSNKFIDLYFDRGVYDATLGPVTAASFGIIDFVAGGVTVITIGAVKKPDHHVSASASALVGGESKVRVFLTLTGTPDGTGSFRIRVADDSVYDIDGVAMSGAVNTGTLKLNVNLFNLWDGEVPTLNTSVSLGVSAMTDLMGNVNLAQATDADRPFNYVNRAIQFDRTNTEFFTAAANANYQKQKTNDFAIIVKDLRPNIGTDSGWIMAYFNGANNHGWTLRAGGAGRGLQLLIMDNVTPNQAVVGNFDNYKASFIVQQESGVVSFYDENNNRIGAQGVASIGTIVWTSISLFVGRRETITTNYFNGEWAKLGFVNQALTSDQRLRIFSNLKRQKAGVAGTLTKYLHPIVNTSIVSSDKDTMQVFVGDVVYRSGVYHLFYTGNAADGDIDRGFKATKTDDSNPWTLFTKHLTTGSPTVILGPSLVNGTYDENEVFIRTVFYDEIAGHWKMYFTANQIGASPAYTTGLATSADGTTFTKVGQVYTDGTSDIIYFAVVQVGAGDYRALITRSLAGGGATNSFIFDYATSADGQTFTNIGAVASSVPQSILIVKILKVGNEFIIFSTSDNRDAELSSGTKTLLHKTTDFSTFVYLGELLAKSEPGERSVNVCAVVQKGGQTEFFYTYLKNQNKTASNGGEGFSAIRMAILNSLDIAQANIVDAFPPWVKKYWPLNAASATGDAFREMIDEDTASFPGAQWSLGLHFFDFLGTGFSFVNNGLIFSPTDFALKLRVEIVLIGTVNLFSVGTDIVVQLVSGNLRVALNNATKDYITTGDIAKPAGITDPGNHVNVGFIWQGGTLRLCVGNTVGIAVTQTVNNAMTDIANGGANVLLCSGATIEARSFVTMSGQTDQQWLDTDL